jgi:hypothetical protein
MSEPFAASRSPAESLGLLCAAHNCQPSAAAGAAGVLLCWQAPPQVPGYSAALPAFLGLELAETLHL